MRYALVSENAGGNFSAYVPDLPGCVAIGTTVQETEMAIREAIEFHLEALREDAVPAERYATSGVSFESRLIKALDCQ